MVKKIQKIVGFRITRFVAVGILNTGINFAILNIAFYGLHEAKLVSSFMATSVAVLCSFVLNRYFVFKHNGHIGKQMLRFFIVTAVGVLLIQNLIYAIALHLLGFHEAGIISFVYSLVKIKVASSFVDVNLSNLVASMVVMIWNYNGYRLHVFKGVKSRQ